MIRTATADDISSLIALAEATGLFQPHEVEAFGGMMQEQLAEENESEDRWIVDDDDGIKGAAYYAPEVFAEGVWNLYFIGVHPTEQKKGRGSTLLKHVEKTLQKQGDRILLIETSSTTSFEKTRSFYRKNKYEEEARIRDFYQAGYDK
ncbi:MAG: GNAT family N-acetyltransferase, partial [Cyanobacteria bacterium J06576_12]